MYLTTHIPTGKQYLMRYRPEYPTLYLPQIWVDNNWVATENFGKYYRITIRITNIKLK